MLEANARYNAVMPAAAYHPTAFGSTEIGKFSRSEYFANMVGEKNNEVEEDKKDDIPERYLSVPRMFPFPMACQNIFKTPNVIDDTKKHNDLYSRTVHDGDGCYWFAKQSNNSITKFSNNGNTICTRPPDCIHRANEGQDFHNNPPRVSNLSNIETILRRYNGKCCIVINDDDHVEDENYILIDTDNSDEDVDDDDNDEENENEEDEEEEEEEGDGSSYIEDNYDDNDNNFKLNDINSYRNENNRQESSKESSKESFFPKCSKE
ncbi:hypothetical protein M0802_010494 [Mischocyttarus mexicanus]|nr:hypothetical protein M0802_010494 [Mischocyttarus mexicanus]